MTIKFNYRYYLDDNQFETYHLELDQLIEKKVAKHMDEVGHVIRFAELQQQQGRYVALYVTYEAARYFNPQMDVCHVEEGGVLAIAYSFKVANHINESKKLNNASYQPKHQFKFIESNQQMKEKIKSIQHAIVEGDTYQVNYTTRLTDNIYFPIHQLYRQLTTVANGNYTALLDTDEVKVASISPELFFQKGIFNGETNVLVSKPMKGTMPRGETNEEDLQNYHQLQQSEKDKAENVMIVDLLRNDISRISKPGTIHVNKPFFIESYKTVYQMTSMVSGRLEAETSLTDILKALFPCGSITGAPKLNTMSYIKALEANPRYIYCGTIGLLCPDDKMIFNIPIRTLEYRNEKVHYGVGAGITIDSIPEKEVQEFRDKTKILEML